MIDFKILEIQKTFENFLRIEKHSRDNPHADHDNISLKYLNRKSNLRIAQEISMFLVRLT